MTKNICLFALAAALLIQSPAYAAEETSTSQTKVQRDDQGNYVESNKAEKEDAAGTVITQESQVKVNKDSNGNVERKVENKTTTDPKGLFNKTVKKTTDETKVKSDGTQNHIQRTTVNGTTVDESTSETAH